MTSGALLDSNANNTGITVSVSNVGGNVDFGSGGVRLACRPVARHFLHPSRQRLRNLYA